VGYGATWALVLEGFLAALRWHCAYWFARRFRQGGSALLQALKIDERLIS